MDAVRSALDEALSLFFPIDCAGCGIPDVPLCLECRAGLAPRPRSVLLSSGVEVHAGLAFDGVPARVVRALKENGRTGLARPLAPALAAAARAADAGGAVIVPVPTSRAAMRRRGYRVVELVARRAGLQVERLLVPSRASADQRTLGRDERRRNVAGTMAARSAAGRRILLVDDVVTTGATLDEAVRVLRAAGADVVAAATVAATPLHRRHMANSFVTEG